MVSSRETLQHFAAERELQLTAIERVDPAGRYSRRFRSDASIGAAISPWKAARHSTSYHSDLDLLSVDIDVNYVCATEKKGMDADQIARLMAPKGHTIRREPSEHAGDKWSYRYSLLRSAVRGLWRATATIPSATTLYVVDRMPSAAIGSYRATNVPVFDDREIVAGKMVALVTRRAARDLFCSMYIGSSPCLISTGRSSTRSP